MVDRTFNGETVRQGSGGEGYGTGISQTGKLPLAHFYPGWRRTDVERRPTAVRRRSAVVLRIVSGAEKKNI